MGYQNAVLKSLGSMASGLSVASLLYRQSPEGQIELENKKAKAQNTERLNQIGRKADFINQTIPEGEEKYEATENLGREAYNAYMKSYMDDPDPKYTNSAKNIYKAVDSMENAKAEKRQKDAWRSMSTNMGMNLGEITDRLGPKAEEIVKKEMAK